MWGENRENTKIKEGKMSEKKKKREDKNRK
jgi:hypothetical protein